MTEQGLIPLNDLVIEPARWHPIQQDKLQKLIDLLRRYPGLQFKPPLVDRETLQVIDGAYPVLAYTAHFGSDRRITVRWKEYKNDESRQRDKDWHSARSMNDAKRSAIYRKRAQDKEAYVEDVDFMTIYERDKGLCRICGEGVDINIRFPSPGAATLDHILPLSKGGKHQASNVQLAHLGCNSQRSNKGAAQLRLLP